MMRVAVASDTRVLHVATLTWLLSARTRSPRCVVRQHSLQVLAGPLEKPCLIRVAIVVVCFLAAADSATRLRIIR